MPIPFIIAGVAAGAVGLYKGGKAISDNSKANEVNKEAQEVFDKAKKKLETARDMTGQALKAFGEKKITCYSTTVKRFLGLYNQIKGIEMAGGNMDELSSFKIDKQCIAEFTKLSELAASMAGAAATGVLAGGAVAFGAYGAAGALAAASTGTPIAALSGAAATNATLAFFGGGSLAAGGLGVAGGTMVLGGLVAGPALLVIGAIMGAKASKNLDDAYSNLAEAKKVSAELDVMTTACNAIKERCDLFAKLLIKYDLLMMKMNNSLQQTIKEEGWSYRSYSNRAKECCQAVLSTASALAAILRTPLLDKNGKLKEDSLTIAQKAQNMLPA